MLGTMWRMTHLTILCTFNHQLARFCDHTIFVTFSTVYNNQRFSNCSSTMDVGFVKLLSRLFLCKWSSRWILNSAVTFAAVLLWFIDIILFDVWRMRWRLFPHQRCYTGRVCHEINRCTVTLYCRNCSPWLAYVTHTQQDVPPLWSPVSFFRHPACTHFYVIQLANLMCLSSLEMACSFIVHNTCLCILIAACHQNLSCHNQKHCTIATSVFIIICALYTIPRRLWAFTSERHFTCINQTILHIWTFGFLSSRPACYRWSNLRSDNAISRKTCCYSIF